MTNILYGGAYVFNRLAPTPLVSRSVSMVRYGERWGQKHNLTLQGSLTGKCIQYADFLQKQRALLSGFSRDLQSLAIYDDATLVEQFDYVKINGIEFSESSYANGYIPFTISLECYPSGYFSGEFGVLSPREEVKFDEAEDGQISVTHIVSAVGFCTSSSSTNNALDNARQWVQERTGWSSQVLPAFISGASNGLCLQQVQESIDRLNGQYEVVESYLGDRYGTASAGLLRYSSEYNSGIEDGISSVKIGGSIQGCRYEDISDLRARYQSFNAYSEASNQFYRITNRADLNPFEVSKGVSEDVNNRTIVFDYLYDDDKRPKISVVYSIDFEYSYEEDVISARISATITSRAEHSTHRWADILAVANSVNLYSLVMPAYQTYVQQVAPHLAATPLNPREQNQSRSENEYGGSVTLSATFDNRQRPPYGLDVFNSKISVTPSIRKYNAQPILNQTGQYYIFDLGFDSRGTINVTVDGVGADSISPQQTLEILRHQAQSLALSYLSGTKRLLDSRSETTGNVSFGRSISLSAQWSAESAKFIL